MSDKRKQPDFRKSYLRFISAKGIPGSELPKKEAWKLGLERHHILPRCEGNGYGENYENMVWLSSNDHILAHWIMNVARVQKGESPIPYFPSDTPKAETVRWNPVRMWNPLSKAHVRFGSEVLTIGEAAKRLERMARKGGFPPDMRKKTKKRLERIATGANPFPYLFEVCSREEKDRIIGCLKVELLAGEN